MLFVDLEMVAGVLALSIACDGGSRHGEFNLTAWDTDVRVALDAFARHFGDLRGRAMIKCFWDLVV